MLTSLRSFGAQRFRLLPVGLIVLVSWVWNSQAAAQSVTLAWDPTPNAAGYRLYVGTTTHVYTQQINVGNATSTLVSNLISGKKYFFAVTAYNTTGLESAFSNEVSYTPGAPTPTPTPTPSPTPTPRPCPTPTATPTLIQITVNTNPAGLKFTVDGVTHSSAQTFSWKPGSSHTIATTSPQNGSGTRYVWNSWSDSGGISHIIAPTASKTYTAKFTTQYFLTMYVGAGGLASPVSGWQNSGSSIKMTATPSTGYHFTSWSGIGTGSFSGTTNPVNITMGGPISEKATFTHN